MELVSVDDVEADRSDGGAARRTLSDALGADDLAINRYRVGPGERLAGLHAHVDQEEVFLVVAGTLTFETLDGVVTVHADQAIRFGPGEFQSARNAADRLVEVYALGAPRESEDVRVPLQCLECSYGTLRPHRGEDELELVCPECGERTDGSCPDCDSGDVLVVLEGESAVARCQDCDALAWP